MSSVIDGIYCTGLEKLCHLNVFSENKIVDPDKDTFESVDSSKSNASGSYPRQPCLNAIQNHLVEFKLRLQWGCHSRRCTAKENQDGCFASHLQLTPSFNETESKHDALQLYQCRERKGLKKDDYEVDESECHVWASCLIRDKFRPLLFAYPVVQLQDRPSDTRSFSDNCGSSKCCLTNNTFFVGAVMDGHGYHGQVAADCAAQRLIETIQNPHERISTVLQIKLDSAKYNYSKVQRRETVSNMCNKKCNQSTYNELHNFNGSEIPNEDIDNHHCLNSSRNFENCSSACATSLHRHWKPQCLRVCELMQKAFCEAHSTIVQRNNTLNVDFGSTCLVVAFLGPYLITANCGDSVGLLIFFPGTNSDKDSTSGLIETKTDSTSNISCPLVNDRYVSASKQSCKSDKTNFHTTTISNRKCVMISLNRPHTLYVESELDRILSSQGEIVVGTSGQHRLIPKSLSYAEAKRQGLSINMSRALGHKDLSHAGLSPLPEFRIVDILATISSFYDAECRSKSINCSCNENKKDRISCDVKMSSLRQSLKDLNDLPDEVKVQCFRTYSWTDGEKKGLKENKCRPRSIAEHRCKKYQNLVSLPSVRDKLSQLQHTTDLKQSDVSDLPFVGQSKGGSLPAVSDSSLSVCPPFENAAVSDVLNDTCHSTQKHETIVKTDSVQKKNHRASKKTPVCLKRYHLRSQSRSFKALCLVNKAEKDKSNDESLPNKIQRLSVGRNDQCDGLSAAPNCNLNENHQNDENHDSEVQFVWASPPVTNIIQMTNSNDGESQIKMDESSDAATNKSTNKGTCDNSNSMPETNGETIIKNESVLKNELLTSLHRALMLLSRKLRSFGSVSSYLSMYLNQHKLLLYQLRDMFSLDINAINKMMLSGPSTVCQSSKSKNIKHRRCRHAPMRKKLFGSSSQLTTLFGSNVETNNDAKSSESVKCLSTAAAKEPPQSMTGKNGICTNCQLKPSSESHNNSHPNVSRLHAVKKSSDDHNSKGINFKENSESDVKSSATYNANTETPDLLYVVLMSDGVSDVMRPSEIASILLKFGRQQVSEKRLSSILTHMAEQKRRVHCSPDNCTSLVIKVDVGDLINQRFNQI